MKQFIVNMLRGTSVIHKEQVYTTERVMAEYKCTESQALEIMASWIIAKVATINTIVGGDVKNNLLPIL